MNVPSRETLLDIEWLIHTHTAEGYEALLRVVRAGAEAYGGLVTAVAEAVLRLRWPSGDPRLLDAADIRHGLAHALATGSWSTDLDLVARVATLQFEPALPSGVLAVFFSSNSAVEICESSNAHAGSLFPCRGRPCGDHSVAPRFADACGSRAVRHNRASARGFGGRNACGYVRV